MTRPWISLLLLSLVLVVIEAAMDGDIRNEVEPCPANNVCVIFSRGTVTNHKGKSPGSDTWRGDLWEADSTIDEGYKKKGVDVSLWIEPLSLHKWTLTVTSWVEDYPFTNIGFEFGDNAKISWTGGNKTHLDLNLELSWKNGDQSLSSRHLCKMTATFMTTAKSNYERYSCEIESEDENLITLFGVDRVKWVDSAAGGEMIDPRFKELLDQLSPCDLSELNDACKGGSCEKIVYDNRTVGCSSNLWYHSAADDGMVEQWKPLDSIKCHKGKWEGNVTEKIEKEEEITTDSTEEGDEEETGDGTGEGTTEGTGGARRRRDDQPEMSTSASTEGNSTDSIAGEPQIIDLSSKKVQCSANRPSAMTSTANMLIGIGGAIFGILVLCVIGAVVFIVLRRKRNAGAKNTFRDSDSKAQTPKESKKSTRTGSVAEVGAARSSAREGMAQGCSAPEIAGQSEGNKKSNKFNEGPYENADSKEDEKIVSKEGTELKEQKWNGPPVQTIPSTPAIKLPSPPLSPSKPKKSQREKSERASKRAAVVQQLRK